MQYTDIQNTNPKKQVNKELDLYQKTKKSMLKQNQHAEDGFNK